MKKHNVWLNRNGFGLKLRSKRFTIPLLLLLVAVPVAFAELPTVGAITGRDTVAIILVEFSDVQAQQPVEYFSRNVLSELSAYYDEVSYGQYLLDGHVVGWFTLQRPLSDFNVTKRGAPDRGKLLAYTFRSIDVYVNFKLYDHVFVVYTGGVYAFLREFRYVSDEGGRITEVAVADETDRLQVYLHEFGHILGLPDLYDYDRVRKSKFIGDWDIMGSADYPVHFSAWTKIRLGWIMPSQISQIELGRGMLPRTITIAPLEVKTSGINVIKVPIPGARQYYLVELRLKIGYDANLPSSGILVTYVDEAMGTGYGIVRVQSNEKGDTYDLSSSSENVFIENRSSFSVIVLSKSLDAWTVSVSNVPDGFAAKRTATALFEASAAISKAELEIRTDGLNAAHESLEAGWDSYGVMDFTSAEQYAAMSTNLAMKATHPPAYLAAEASIENVKAKLLDLRQQKFKASFARILLLEADQELRRAEESLRTGDFNGAVLLAENADKLIVEALLAEQEFSNPTQEKPPNDSTSSTEVSQGMLMIVPTALLLIAIAGIITVRTRSRRPISVERR